MGFDYRISTELRKQTLGGHKEKLVCTRTQKKGTVIPKETEPDLPMTVQESSVEAWPAVGSVRGPEYNKVFSGGMACCGVSQGP